MTRQDKRTNTGQDIEENLYDVEIADEEITDNKHSVKVRTMVDGEEYVKWFNFSPRQTAEGHWKKHIKLWIDEKKKKNDVPNLKGNLEKVDDERTDYRKNSKEERKDYKDRSSDYDKV